MTTATLRVPAPSPVDRGAYAPGCRPSLRTQAERNALATANLNLVYGYLQRYQRRHAQDDDVIQAGRMGLLRAAEMYDPDRLKPDGTPHQFATYAYRAIHTHVIRELRSRGGVIHVPIGTRFADDAARARGCGSIHGGEGIGLEQPPASEFAEDPRAVRLTQIEIRLSKRDRVLLECRRSGMSSMRTAAEMDLSPERVKQLYGRLVRRLREAKEYKCGLFDSLMETV